MKEKTLRYIVNDQTIYIWIDTEHGTMSGTFLKDDDTESFGTLAKALKEQNTKVIKEIVGLKFNLIQAINSFGDGKVGFEEGELFYVNQSGEKSNVDTKLTAKIKSLIHAGASAEILVKFLDNLIGNPDRRAVQDFYDFLIVNNLAMTDDGHFLAYKIVRDDFKDLYTGTMDNSPGKVVSMDRSKVNPDPNHTCSYGLHICSKDYLPHYGGFYGSGSKSKILVVKVNPADVVAFPKDYRNAKARVCSYTVLGTIESENREFLKDQIAKLEAGVTADVEAIKKIIKQAVTA
ncbi:hypothetical protein D3C76_102760 [compost metagenome]